MNPQAMMLSEWCASVGVCRRTAQRWREMHFNGEPMLSVKGNINGLYFITEEEDARFWAKANAGEFAKEIARVCAAGEMSEKSPLVQLIKAKRRSR